MLTVVIPIYNSEDTLRRCIDSILAQTYKDFELLLIDDGSTDGSPGICDGYAKRDTRVRVIHRANEGLVSGRKLGAKEARTNYIAFVDSDDWMEPDSFEIMMMPVLENSDTDLVITGMIYDNGRSTNTKQGVISPGWYAGADIDTIVQRMMYQWDEAEFGIIGSVCGKIYKRSLFAETVNRIDNRITYGEDDALVYTLIPKCKSICILDGAYYHYCNVAGTMSTSFTTESFYKLEILKDFFEKTYKECGLWPRLRDGVHQIICMFLFLALSNVYGLNMGHQFPFSRIPKGSKIVLYGAGAVGKDFYHALRGSGYADVVAMIDSDYENKGKDGWNVNPIDYIDDKEYDFIIICMEARDTANAVKRMLI